LAGSLADLIGMPGAIGAIGLLTMGSGVFVGLRMPVTLAARSATRR
jgi:hypothetical protein